MKRKILIALALFVCLSAVCLFAAAEGEKTEGEWCYFVDQKEHIVFSRNAYTRNDPEYTGANISMGREHENAVLAEISFVSGDEKLKGLYSWDPSRPDSVAVHVPPEGTEGEAVFHIRMETEHYYKEGDFTAKVMTLGQTIDTSPVLIRGAVGRAVDPAVYFRDRAPEIAFMPIVAYWMPLLGFNNPEFDMDFGDLVPKAEGDYRLTGIMSLGDAGVNLEIPVVVYTGESISQKTSQWLAKLGYDQDGGAGKTGGSEEPAASAAAGDELPAGGEKKQRDPDRPFDDHGLSGYWTTSAYLENGKEKDKKDRISIALYLRPSGDGVEHIEGKGDTADRHVTWEAADREIEVDTGKQGIERYVLNGDGSITTDLGNEKYSVTLVRQDWPAELTEEVPAKAADLFGKWALCAVEVENEGIIPLEMLTIGAKHFLTVDEEGHLLYFRKSEKEQTVAIFNLSEENGKLSASELAGDSAPIPVRVFENGWLEFTRYKQRFFFVYEDFWNFTISAENGAKTVPAGKKLSFAVEYEQPGCVEETESWFTWFVRRADGSDASGVASIDKNGVLTIDRNLKERVPLEVSGKSAGYTTASWLIDAVPALKKLTLTPDKAVIYLGETEPLTVTAAAEPADALPAVLDWKVTGKGAELEAAGSGAVRITAAQAGRATVQVKDPAGGKTAKMTVEVLEPVTGIEITGPETVKAGKTANYKAALTPKKPGDKTVIWSVDAEESVATVSKNGQLKVSKTAPAGTVITLTGRAQGSPKEVLATLKITVE